jgi:hypothetical protein
MRYLLITYVRKPNGQIDEMVGTSKKLKVTDRQMCNVILDFANKKVEKCVIEGKVVDMDWDKVNQYYKKIYPAIIAQLEKEADITSKEKSK